MVRIKLLILAAVADRLSRGVNAACQGCIRDDAAAPDCCDEFVLAHDVIAVLHQINQEIENLRFYRNRFSAAAEFATAGIENVIGKDKLHVVAPPGGGHACTLPHSENIEENSTAIQGRLKRGFKSVMGAWAKHAAKGLI